MHNFFYLNDSSLLCCSSHNQKRLFEFQPVSNQNQIEKPVSITHFCYIKKKSRKTEQKQKVIKIEKNNTIFIFIIIMTAQRITTGLFNFRQQIGSKLCVLEQSFDQASQFLSIEVDGKRAFAVVPVVIDVFQRAAQHEDQFLKFDP